MSHELEHPARALAAQADLREEESRLKALVGRILDMARERGAGQAEVGVSLARGLGVSVRKGEVETVEFTRDQGFGVTVFFGRRKGTASTSDASEAAIRDAVERACTIARATAEDPHAGLADPGLMAERVEDLDLYHRWGLDSETAQRLALDCEAAGLDYDARINNSEGANVSSMEACRTYGNSHGFVGSYCAARHGMSAALIASDAHGMQRDHWYTVSRVPSELEDGAFVGRRAAQRALGRLGARPVATARVPVVFAAEVAVGLIGQLIAAISGGNIYRRASFLCDALGEQVLPERITVAERPRIPRGLGSAPFDEDGLATREQAFVRDGVLDRYVLSTYSARRLGMESTANAGGVHNLTVSDDGLEQAALLERMGRGLLVTELMGQGVNLLTGDYSRGAAGYWVEDGRVASPVQEVTVAGNLREMLHGIDAVGADTETRGNVRCGSLLIDGMTVAGS